MDEKILIDIIESLPQLTTRELHKEYNDVAPIPFKSYNNFISQLTKHKDVYDKLMLSKDTRNRKIQLALQEAESALIANASLGDIKSIEFLLKTQKEEYRDRMKLDINTKHEHQVNIINVVSDKLQQLTNNVTVLPNGDIQDAPSEYIIDAEVDNG